MEFYSLYTCPEIQVIKPRITSTEHVTCIRGKVRVKFTLEQATKAQRVQLDSFFNLGGRWG